MTVQTRVLVVDDDLPVQTGLRDYLEDDGFYVRCAGTAEEALEILGLEQFDVAVVDIRLPTMDGNALITKVYEIHPEIKFLIFTGSTEYDLPESLRELGISSNDVLCKPLHDISIITHAIRRVIAGGEKR